MERFGKNCSEMCLVGERLKGHWGCFRFTDRHVKKKKKRKKKKKKKKRKMEGHGSNISG
jgi:hypothetical protein